MAISTINQAGLNAPLTLTSPTLTTSTLVTPNITTGLTIAGAAGTAGQALLSGGSGAAPSWGSAGKVLQTTIVYSSDTRVAFSSEANVSLTGANDFRYTPSARIGGSITKISSTSYCIVWAQYAAWVNSTNWHDTYMWESTTNTNRHIGWDAYRMSGNRYGMTFTAIFSGLSTGTRTFYLAPGSGDSRTNTGALNYNPQTDTGNGDTTDQTTWSQMIVMEVEP